MASIASPGSIVPQNLVLPEHRSAYYGGSWHAPKSARYADVINPGTGESLGQVASQLKDQVDCFEEDRGR